MHVYHFSLCLGTTLHYKLLDALVAATNAHKNIRPIDFAVDYLDAHEEAVVLNVAYRHAMSWSQRYDYLQDANLERVWTRLRLLCQLVVQVALELLDLRLE